MHVGLSFECTSIWWPSHTQKTTGSKHPPPLRFMSNQTPLFLWTPDKVRTNHKPMKWTNSFSVFHKVTCHLGIHSRWQVSGEEVCTLTLYGLISKFILRSDLYSHIRKTQPKNEVLAIGNTFVTGRWSWSQNSSLMRWYHMIAMYFTIMSNIGPKYFATAVFIQ